MTNYNIGGLRPLSVTARLNSCQIARKSQGFSHVIFLAIFIYCSWSKGGDLHGNQLLYLVSNALWLGSGISVTCQEDAKQEICLWTINSNPGKTLFLNNLESGDVVGDKVEIIAITVLLENLNQRYR